MFVTVSQEFIGHGLKIIQFSSFSFVTEDAAEKKQLLLVKSRPENARLFKILGHSTQRERETVIRYMLACIRWLLFAWFHNKQLDNLCEGNNLCNYADFVSSFGV